VLVAVCSLSAMAECRLGCLLMGVVSLKHRERELGQVSSKLANLSNTSIQRVSLFDSQK